VINPGQPLFLLLDGKPIQTRSCRIWAVGLKSGKKWENLKKRTVLLVESPYRARKVDTHTHRFD
jgi:hypothetical protein